MSKKTLVAIATVVVLGAAVVSAGCVRVPLPESQRISFRGDPGESSTETTSAPLGGATRVDATIRMGVGDLAVSSVSSQTAGFTGRFRYNPQSWKPEVTYLVNPAEGGAVGVLYVGQPEASGPMSWVDAENRWDLALASGVPTDISLKMGVGQGAIDLSAVDVRHLEAVTGVGETEIDLNGPRSADVSGTITTGVGETTIRLPSNVGVQITGGGDGLGNVSSEGLTGGNVLTNEAWSQPGPKITLKIVRGVGDIRIELVD